jgi:DegV family protein with EDD domain
LPPSYYEERGVPLATFHYDMDGVQYPDDMGKTMPLSEFYSRIEAGSMPVTSQVNTEGYVALFEPFLSAGIDVLHLSLSSGISGSYFSAKIAEQDLRVKYPERKLYVIDSQAASSGYGLLVDKALDLQAAGSSIDEVYEYIEVRKLHLQHLFFATSLKHLKRGGRISATSAMVGALLSIVPICDVNNEGKLIPRSKARGKKHAIAELVTRMKAHADHGTRYSGKVFISQSACREDAETLANAIRAEFPDIDGEIRINNIGSVIGAHTGPGTVALFFWGDKRGE